MTHPSVKVQIVPESVPSTPSWFGEVAVLAHVLTQFGILGAIQQGVQFARARFGHYDTIDFVVVLIGYAVSGEPTLKAFYERLWPFAPTFMALFGRSDLPCPRINGWAPFLVQEMVTTEKNCDKPSKPSRRTRRRLRFPSLTSSCASMDCMETRLLCMRSFRVNVG